VKNDARVRADKRSHQLQWPNLNNYGTEFFRLACERDLEGIVAKLKHAGYGERWYKIRNPGYSQCEGRREMCEKKQAAHA
jgi:ATP-dependent DNA ligase